MFGRRRPELITAVITMRKDRSYAAWYIGDDDGPVKEPRPAGTISELRNAIEPTLIAHYGLKLAPEGMGVGFAIYPWPDRKVPKPMLREVGTDYLVFDIEESAAGFQATNEETGISASAESLDALVPAVAARVMSRWPSLGIDVPGCLNWQRTLTASGFTPFRR